nr:MAG TPA: tail connector protein [Bacteriophage sp.]
MIDTAVQMVRSYVGASELPDKIAHRAVLEVARELNTRMLSPGGVFSAFADAGSPVRLARDPLRAVYPMLAPYVRPGFA